MKWSFSSVLTTIFLTYVAYSLWSMIQIFIPPKCSDKYCLNSYLATKPELQIILCTSKHESIKSFEELTLVDIIKPFDYSLEYFAKNITIDLPKSTRKNGTLNLFAFITPIPNSKETWVGSVQNKNTMFTSFKLTLYLVPEAETFNLLNTNKNEKDSPKKKSPIGVSVAHITKRLRITMMTELHSLPKKELPEDFIHLLRIDTYSDTYLPPVRFDRFNSRLKDFYPINSTESNYTLLLEYSPVKIGNLRLTSQFEQAMSTLENFAFSAKDLDEIKGIFSDTNVFLLTITMFVSSIHLLLDFLAFKNDILFWKKRRTVVGLSSRTILWRCFSQFIIFLYLFEEKSSMLVVIPAAVGTLIEIWKVKKAFKVTVHIENYLPKIKLGQLSEQEKATNQADQQSMQYLSYLLYPLCIGGAIYSLLYTPHKSWYSWTIQSLVNGVYAFGFLFMLPQLFVNYRLKSVAHMPWRAFAYKAFNTVLDDFFAFIITMPTAHRVSCFRDDIVFLVYLYQRYLYPVDSKRLDMGGSGEFENDNDEKDVQETGNKIKSKDSKEKAE